MLYYATAQNRKLKNYFGRTKMAFGEIDPRHHKFLLSVEFQKVYVQKNLEATILFVDFFKAFDFILRGKHILLAYGLPPPNRRNHNDAI